MYTMHQAFDFVLGITTLPTLRFVKSVSCGREDVLI
jgi:hypothetical protein